MIWLTMTEMKLQIGRYGRQHCSGEDHNHDPCFANGQVTVRS